MKKWIYMALFGAMPLLSCSSDKDVSDPPTTPEEMIMGKWYLAGGSNKGNPVTLSDCQKQSYLEFLTEDDLAMEWIEFNCATSGTQTFTYTLSTSPDILKIDGDTPIGTSPQTEILKLSVEQLILQFNGENTSMIWERN